MGCSTLAARTLPIFGLVDLALHTERPTTGVDALPGLASVARARRLADGAGRCDNGRYGRVECEADPWKLGGDPGYGVDVVRCCTVRVRGPCVGSPCHVAGCCRKFAGKKVGELSGEEVDHCERHRRGGIREPGVRAHAVKFDFFRNR